MHRKEHSVLPLTGLYEVAIRVKDLTVAETFYREVLGLQVGIRDEKRNWVFLRVGGVAGMVVLQEDKGEWPKQHFAFTIREADLERATEWLRAQGVEFTGPCLHEWMPAKSIYFADPDGHDLELCALNQTNKDVDTRSRRHSPFSTLNSQFFCSEQPAW
jgi:catechol-2,3-dioxygenase